MDRVDAKWAEDRPEPGKLYALTGKPDQPSIAAGDSWKNSEVPKNGNDADFASSLAALMSK